jgi:hypothetical protein
MALTPSIRSSPLAQQPDRSWDGEFARLNPAAYYLVKINSPVWFDTLGGGSDRGL